MTKLDPREPYDVEITIKPDDIVARIWVGKAGERAFERHTEIIRKADNKLLARAVTFWVPVDVETKRPVAAGPDIYEMFST